MLPFYPTTGEVFPERWITVFLTKRRVMLVVKEPAEPARYFLKQYYADLLRFP